MQVQKRRPASNEQGDSLKTKPVEEVLAEIKKKKSFKEDDVASAGLKIVEPQEDDSVAEEQGKEEEEEDGDEQEPSEGDEEGGREKWHVSHGCHMVRGKMEHGMEDYVVAKKRMVNGKELGLYAIFDGHAGRDVARYLQHNLFDNILNQPDFWTDPEAAIKRAYEATDEKILNEVAGSTGGSTAVTAILFDKEKLIVANVGDSRGVLCKRRDIEQITVDHEPEKEKELVESRGGVVFQMPGNVPRVDGQLAMTRAFSDGKLKEHITSEPDVRIEKVGTDAKFIILASDGIWKVMSNEEVFERITDMDRPQEAAEVLVKEALQRGSTDDISCVAVMFQH